MDFDTFRTDVQNFLDHNNVGDSSIFFPLTVSQALIRGWELRSARPALPGERKCIWRTPINAPKGAGRLREA